MGEDWASHLGQGRDSNDLSRLGHIADTAGKIRENISHRNNAAKLTFSQDWYVPIAPGHHLVKGVGDWIVVIKCHRASRHMLANVISTALVPFPRKLTQGITLSENAYNLTLVNHYRAMMATFVPLANSIAD